jgi:hypothetical protein
MPLIETRGAGSAQGFGEFAQSAAVNYIEDVFSTYLYTGNSTSGGTQTITNDIDLSTKGGLVWIKGRSAASDHILTDTVRGVGASATDNNALASNLTSAQDLGGSSYDFLSAFSTTGFTVKQGGTTTATRGTNYDAVTYASWTFRKQAKFFDVVTWTGNNSTRQISHSLGSAPGCIIVKCTSEITNWPVYHRSLGASADMRLNTTAAQDANSMWANTSPTSTVFTVSGNAEVNGSGRTYVAYLFAHNAGGFGLSGTDNVISCGSFATTATSDSPIITLGYEPQFVLIKQVSGDAGGGDWGIFDNMRGVKTGGVDAYLRANTSSAELTTSDYVDFTATGFIRAPNIDTGANTYIYIAIRRGPMKVPTAGTSVFSPIARAGTSAMANVLTGFVTDAALIKIISGGFVAEIFDRLRGANVRLYPDQTSAESTATDHLTSFATNDGYSLGASTSGEVNLSGYNYANWSFRRAPGFMDVVCDTGTGSAHTIAHNLGAVPELMIRKKRSAADNWVVYANNDNTDYLVLNTTAATVDDITMWNDTSPTSSVFTVGTNDDVNQNTGRFVTYLFATVAGVSKVGSYTGSGTTKQIDCGFTGGARFVLIKRTDSTGDWYVWDSARGIVSGDDPYLLLNSTAAEVTNTDYVDTYSAGFEISSTAPAALNANGGTYIFLAIA